MTREEIKSSLIAGKTIVESALDKRYEYNIDQLVDRLFCELEKYKPRTITVNGIEIPEPLRVEPKETSDTTVFVSAGESSIYKIRYQSVYHRNLFYMGALHLTQEAAQAHYDALWAPSRIVK